MMRGFVRRVALALTLSSAAEFLVFSAQTADAQTAPVPLNATELAQWQQSLAAWRAAHEKDVSSPGGWLTLAGLEWLKPGINSIGASSESQIRLPGQAPAHLGMLTVNDKAPNGQAIQLLAPSGGFPPELTLDGKPAREGALVVDNARPSTIGWHGLSLSVLKRGDRYVASIKDADSPARIGFHGLNWYAPDPKYRITARWVPFKPAQVEEIPTVIGTTLKLPAPGLAVFLLDGEVLHLEPVLEDPSGKTLFFILRDETSKSATYGGGRFLHTGLPDHGLDQPGSLVLDFNELENPPCTYTIFATCPLPPEQNRLDVTLQAGEQRYQR